MGEQKRTELIDRITRILMDDLGLGNDDQPRILVRQLVAEACDVDIDDLGDTGTLGTRGHVDG